MSYTQHLRKLPSARNQRRVLTQRRAQRVEPLAPPPQVTPYVSAIDPTKPVFGTPTTQSVRDNFAAAKSEIEALQSSVAGGVTLIGTGTGLTGGPITSSGTIALADTAVSPGTYQTANLTVDAQGRITSAANGAATALHTTPAPSLAGVPNGELWFDSAGLQLYVAHGGAWVVAINQSGFVIDAPSDGHFYSRHNASWSQVAASDLTGTLTYANLPAEVQQVPISFPFSGKPAAGAVVNVPMAMALTIPASLAGTKVYDTTQATANAVFTLNKITAGGASVATTWNPTDMSAGSTLTGGNLIWHGNNATGVRSVASNSAGKFYFEYSVTADSNSFIAGVANSSADLTGIWGTPTNACGVLGSGTIFLNVSNVGSIGTSANGVVVGVALDMDAKLIWFRNATAGGNWNNSGTASPATGTGGISISSIAGTPLFGAASSGVVGNCVATANFGASAFTGAVPSGFQSGFLGISGPTTTPIGTVTITSASHNSCTLSGSGGSLAAGDVLQIVAPSTQDATLADIGISIMASRV